MMELFSRPGFEAFVLGLPAVTLVEQWGSSVAKVGGKVFSTFGLSEHDVTFKVSATTFAGLTTLQGIGQARYSAKGQWVSVRPGADLPETDLAAYLGEAHRIISLKLTRKLRAELGLAP
jgi:predicted DNA-binding protein (MmcQ/YjbR family)